MANLPVRFQRMMDAFDADMALSRVKPGSESSGSEHSPESSPELSDLVLSFMEDNERSGEEEEEEKVVCGEDRDEKVDEEDLEKIEMLKSLFDGNKDVEENERDDKERIRREVEIAIGGLVGSDNSFPGFKRWLMTQLREKGFDAGLCKTKWEKNGKLTAGDYEYIDVNLSEKRYIVEVSLSSEFEIARPTNQYSSLLEIFPMIFVGKVEEFKRIVRLMSSAIKGSMKRMDLHVAPWRRNLYMQTKWFSSYKRTTNAVGTRKESSHFSAESFFPKKFMGFEERHVKVYNCRDDYVRVNNGFRVGHLTAVLNSDNFGL
ncbi:unnamed protein product [Lathyrus oleraceus]|uniref:DUF506 family protein n=1 Tax=Pisum sativum TaxID=3888 RepID=A0A9D5GZR2_PEA|nr:uncharacterized protein LOC127115838 [Pisum sativum]KAI5447106.1 hypothetical protein KIW84_014817 [Pisum sativum]